jgi:hypothetical protein
MKQLDEFIRLAEGLVSPDLCDSIIWEYEKDKNWKEGVVAASEADLNGFKPRNCEVLPISDTKVIGWNNRRKEMDQGLFNTFNKVVETYLVEQEGNCWVTYDAGYELLRYQPGGYYNFHTDCGSAGHNYRTLSIILNLSKAEDYEGGELEFKGGPTYSLNQGDVVIFPSNFLYPHRITPITEGTRYSIVTWFS